MPNSLASFAIHVDDVKRARRFYETVFGWTFEPWGPPDFYLIHTGTEEKPGIQGLMHKRMEPSTGGGLNGFECTFAVGDVEAVARAVESAGGTVTMQPAKIPTVGTVIKFRDPEGNILCAMRFEKTPHT